MHADERRWKISAFIDELVRRSPLATAWRRFEHLLDDFMEQKSVAA